MGGFIRVSRNHRKLLKLRKCPLYCEQNTEHSGILLTNHGLITENDPKSQRHNNEKVREFREMFTKSGKVRALTDN